MKAIILHESKGRIRFRIGQKKMTLQEADVLENWFQKKSWITQVTVHERTGCVIPVSYTHLTLPTILRV